ncbi:MAG: pyridoxamine 5'-phosphate oxidase family protein [Pseudonocardiaceae bacterium]
MTAGERGAELQVLSDDDCYRLLATQQIGRLGVNAEHYPLIFPVNYALDPDIRKSVNRTHSDVWFHLGIARRNLLKL